MTIPSLSNAAGFIPSDRTATANERAAEQHSRVITSSPQPVAETQKAPAAMTVEERQQTALQVVNRTLSAAYEKISSRGGQATADYTEFEPLTAEKVANNILGFIERRLQADVADGASQDELQARLNAGLSGFKKGFAEASEKLEALSLLSPEVKTDIGNTYDLVIKGIDELQTKFIEAATTPEGTSSTIAAPVAHSQINSTAKKASTTLKVPEFIAANKAASAAYGSYEYASARRFSFSLTTQEGDKLTITASASEGYAMEAGRSSKGGASSGFYNASYSADQSMSWQVEGDLNDDELNAINDLLARVNDLAGQFFSGNLDAAFDQAVNLGYDDSQIGKFSLNLKQVELQQVTQAYKSFAPTTESGNNEGLPGLLKDHLSPISNFMQDLLDALDQASLFSEPTLLLTDIGKNIVDEGDTNLNQGVRFEQFMKKMFSLTIVDKNI